MTVRTSLSSSLALFTALVGCGEASTVPEDMAIVFDATPHPDLGPPDLGPLDPEPGDSCRSAADCGEGTCIDEWPGGYCTGSCSADADCGTDGTCVQVDRTTFICLDNCDPDDGAACREGYGCTTDPFFGNVCIPGCRSNDDCPDGLECDPAGGDLGEGSCFDPEGEVGASCEDASECPAGGVCLDEPINGWPRGSCITTGCDTATNDGCPDGSECAFESRFGGLCVQGCATSDDCRDDYGCLPSAEFPDRTVCQPACADDSACSSGLVCNPGLGTCDQPFPPNQLGNECRRFGGNACTGGTCLTEFETGLPGAYCSYLGCTPGADADDGCPGDGVCAELYGSNLCLAGCAEDSDCRAGYACRAVDPDDATRGMGCVAACENDFVCANDEFSCNVGTGFCTTPFASARLGEPCENTTDDCAGGRCLSEGRDGWPAGTCTVGGCPLTDDATGQLCPPSGVCVDDGTGDDIGFCLDSCVTDSTSCRPGYACVALGGASTDGACRPACTPGDCATGSTCSADTGLCEAG